jgi:putative methyltransferase (TIGR04325 family)
MTRERLPTRKRSVLRLFVPPILAMAARRYRARGERTDWEYVGRSWPSASGLRGWNVASVVAAQRVRWPAFDEAVKTSSNLVAADVSSHNTYMCFAYVVGRAALGRSSLTMLDWGGGLGQYGLLVRALYPELRVDYHCHDLRLMVDEGRVLLPEATFHDDETETFARAYDLVMASSSIQYVEHWREKLAQLAAAARSFLYVTRMPIARESPSFVVTQRPASHGYETEYEGWVLNRTEFLAAAEQNGLILQREFLIDEGILVPGAPEPIVYRGFLFGRPA